MTGASLTAGGALVLLVVFACAQIANGQPAPAANPTNISGKVVSLKGSELIVASPSGDVKVAVGDKTVIRNEVAIKFSEISSGMYLGTTASKQPDGTFLASEVHVFSEDQRGTGEGHRPLGNATMTNANVEHVEDVMVRDVKGRMMKLKYKDGEVSVLVPPDIQLVKRVWGPQRYQSRSIVCDQRCRWFTLSGRNHSARRSADLDLKFVEEVKPVRRDKQKLFEKGEHR
jgi:hypothetical protein